MSYPDDVRYTREHEWVREASGLLTVGVTGHATDQLGDIVYVELPEVGRKVEAGKPFGVVEAVKTVSDLFAPVSGEVVEVNVELADHPALVNQDPYGEGWMIRIRAADAGAMNALLTAADYEKLVEEANA